jgi:arylsulfatase
MTKAKKQRSVRSRPGRGKQATTARGPAAPRGTRARGILVVAGVMLAGAVAIALYLGVGRILESTRTGPGKNVLLISVDTLRADHLGLYGYERPTSPRIDELGRAGIVFSQAVCQNTNTNPSHASILSGLYPRTHGNWDNYFMMSDDVPLISEVSRRIGYRTAAFVSGYTLKQKICGLDRGFEVYDDDFTGKERTGDVTTRRAIEWLREHADEPFFLFVHLFDPHGPYDPPAQDLPLFEPDSPPQVVPVERIPKYQRLPRGAPEEEIWTDLNQYKARYDAEIAFSDRQVGRLLDLLDELDLADDTVVLFTSDHGEALDERFHLLDHGGGIGDEEILVPLILRLPAGRHAGRRFDGQVQLIDVVPTLAAAAGIEYPSPVQGKDLLPLLETEPAQVGDPHPHAWTETRIIPLRWQDRSYQLNVRETLKAVRSPAAKLVLFPGVAGNYLELYDLESDPLERQDLYGSRPELAQPLVDRMTDFLRLPTRRNEVADPALDEETREIFRTLGYVD